jgi:ferredoxin
LRSTSLMNAICSVGAVKSVLLRSGVSQERVCVEDADLAIVLNESSCSKCNKCADYCPLGRPLEQITDNADQQCLGCLYCYSVCPDSAISLKGHPGFFAAQIERYDKVIRQIA